MKSLFLFSALALTISLSSVGSTVPDPPIPDTEFVATEISQVVYQVTTDYSDFVDSVYVISSSDLEILSKTLKEKSNVDTDLAILAEKVSWRHPIQAKDIDHLKASHYRMPLWDYNPEADPPSTLVS